jgi:hypothetical protein
MRASDADRDRYAGILQQAFVEGRLTRVEYDERLDAVLNARTYAELEPQVADLPSDNLPVPKPAAPLVPVTAAAGPPMVAVFSGVERKGVWSMPDDNYAVAVFGSVEIDLREAQIAAGVNEIRAYAIFGSVEIIVPPGMVAEVSGVGVFGDFSRGKASAPDPESPVIRVSGLALFGAVNVKEKR